MIKLNCDMGEGMGMDAVIMPLVDMVNLACGFHAGSVEMMHDNVKLAKEYGVMVGAHPSYDDRAHFGRVSVQMASDELIEMIRYQIDTLDAICVEHGVELSYVKPHGALYNDMMRDERLFGDVVTAVSHSSTVRLMILSRGDNSHYAQIASAQGVELLYEIFADRNYMDDGSLVPRSQPHAVIESSEQIVTRIAHYGQTGELMSLQGKPLRLEGDSLCVHGDNAESLEIIEALRNSI